MVNDMLEIIKSIVPRKLRGKLKILFEYLYYDVLFFKQYIHKKKVNFYLILTPEHGNIGDHAIALAVKKYFNLNFNENYLIEISSKHYRLRKNFLFNIINESDVVLITGGGFLGSLWMNEELLVRDILNTFCNNEILILPQTIYFDRNIDVIASRNTYNKHKNLTICVRDENSYKNAKMLLSEEKAENIKLLPDFVLTMNESKKGFRAEVILLCLREDKESIISDAYKNKLIKKLNNIGSEDIVLTSTVVNKRIRLSKRRNEIEKKLDEFRNAKLVITDRLHGMFFSAITGTPCIALDNKSGKVKGGYKWISKLSYISLASNLDDIYDIIEKTKNAKYNYYNSDIMKQKLIELKLHIEKKLYD